MSLKSFLFPVLLGICCCAGCTPTRPVPETTLTASDSALHREWKQSNLQAIAEATPLLQTGDIVLRTGADATSHALMQMNRKDPTYSHCGIVCIESGKPWIYHSTGGEENPDAKLLRETPNQFFTPLSNLGGGAYRYPLTNQQKTALVQKTQDWFREGRTFDMEFDLATDTQLYCAEFVYKAFIAAGFPQTQFSKSYAGGFEYVSIDDLYSGKNAKRICSFQYQ